MRWIAPVVLLMACSDNQTPYVFKPYFFDYTDSAIINIDGVTVEKYIRANAGVNTITGDSVIGFDMVSTTNHNQYYYSISLSVSSPEYGSRLILQNNDSVQRTIAYYKNCCYDVPDNIYEDYTTPTGEADSNFVQLFIDHKNQKVSGRFQASVINTLAPFDTVHLKCDTFIARLY